MEAPGKYKEMTGTAIPVTLAPRQWDSVEKLLRMQENELDKADGLVDQQVICDEMHIGKKTLQNLVASGKISSDMYVVLPNGMKKFKIRKILGLEK